jgi:type VI secretion system secreted protein Hcp
MLNRCAVTIALVLSLPGLAAAADPTAARQSPPARPAPAGHAAAYLKFDGIEGESKDAAHPHWLEAKSLTITGCSAGDTPAAAATTAAPRDAATGQATGRRIHQALTFTKETDVASPKLMQASTVGTRIKKVRVEQQGLVFELHDVFISHFQSSGGSGGGGHKPAESVTLDFAKCTRP